MFHSADKNSRCLLCEVSLYCSRGSLLCLSSERASFLAVSCFEIGYLSPALSAVCQFTHLCMRARFIFFIEPIFLEHAALPWLLSDIHARTDGCAGAAPDP